MAVTEESRYEVHKYFEETMGRERATTLMELLPPVGWGDVATKQDIANLREWVSERMANKDDLRTSVHGVGLEVHNLELALHKVEIDLHKVHNSLLREVRIWAMALFTAMVALTGIAVGFG